MSAAAFKARYAAYTLDLAVLAPAALALCWRPLQGIRQAWRLLEAEIQLALDRAFDAGHVSLLALAEALRADPAFNAAMTSGIDSLLGGLLAAGLLAWGLAITYFAGFEASPWQATPGKRALGLRVEGLDGTHPGVLRSVLRFLAAGPSWLLLHLGHALVMFRVDGRAGHDLAAGTRVSGDGRWPGWAQAWLGLQAGLVLALMGWVAWTFAQALVLMGL